MSRPLIDCFAGERRNLDHLLPIWSGLYPHERGILHVGSRIPSPPPDAVKGRPPHTGGPILVASWGDYRFVARRPVIFLEHGSGQSYLGADGRPDRNPSNPGGRERDRVVLFLCTNKSVVVRNREAYPYIPAEIVGSPRLGALLDIPKPENTAPVVAVSLRWENAQAPESRSALHHYLSALPDLAHHYEVIGTGHPRAWRWLERIYTNAHIEPVRDFEEVVRRADVLLVDNSSAGFEMMALDRPIVWLNSPKYRRNVEHGLRFWSATDGIPTCDHPADLDVALIEALSDPPHVQRRRKEITAEVYSGTLGRATDLCLLAIRELGRSEGWL